MRSATAGSIITLASRIIADTDTTHVAFVLEQTAVEGFNGSFITFYEVVLELVSGKTGYRQANHADTVFMTGFQAVIDPAPTVGELVHHGNKQAILTIYFSRCTED